VENSGITEIDFGRLDGPLAQVLKLLVASKKIPKMAVVDL